MTSTTAGVLVLLGSTVFLVGAAVGVPKVFMEPSAEERLRMLEERLLAWRVAQPLYAIGALLAGIGVGVLGGASTGSSRTALLVAAVALAAGALAWSWSTFQRGMHHEEWARGELPGGPFTAYVWLTVVGLALLGLGVLTGDLPAWGGWLTIGADLAFAAAYVRYGDIPPFVFYALLIPVGISWL